MEESAKQPKMEAKERDQEVNQPTTGEQTNIAPVPKQQADGTDGPTAYQMLPIDNNSRSEPESQNDLVDGQSYQKTHDIQQAHDHTIPTKTTFEYNHSSSTGSSNNRHSTEYVETVQYEQLSPASDSQSRSYTQDTEYQGYGYTKESRETHYERSSRYDDDYRYREKYDYSRESDKGYGGSRHIPSPRERNESFLGW